MSPREPARSAHDLIAEQAKRGDARRDATDPPPRRGSFHGIEGASAAGADNPHATLEKHGKSWGVIVAMLVGLVTVVNIGITVGRRNSEYATVGELNKIRDDVVDVKTTLARIEQKIDDSKAGEVKPIAEQASKNALEAQTLAAKTQGEVDMIMRSIRGFNAAEARRGHATPLPLQDDR